MAKARRTRKSRNLRKSKKRVTRKKLSGGGSGPIETEFKKAIMHLKDEKGKEYGDHKDIIPRFFFDRAGREEKSLEHEGRTYYYYITGMRPINFVVRVGDDKEIVASLAD